jgi:hypothetical protein
MKKLILFSTVLVLLLGGLTTTSWAEAKTGNFYITFDPTLPDPTGGAADNGWEDPASGQRWFLYSNSPIGPFWNQWWYDDPPTVERWKEIFFDLTIESRPFDPANPLPQDHADRVIVALNWSTMNYLETGPAGRPPMPDQEWAIERSIIFTGDVSADDEPIRVENLQNGPFKIPGFNPEWVSMDVWVEYSLPQPPYGNVIEVFGMIRHECVPEPSTLVLLSMGAFGLLLLMRRRGK